MYRKDTDGWLKHWDFILLDMICLQLAFVLAYGLSGYVFNPYQLVKDHRTSYEVGNIDDVMNGNIEGFVTAYLKMQ